MLTFVRVADSAANSAAPVGRIRLAFEGRCVSRQRVRLEDGREAGLILPRGTWLKQGDLVQSEDGRVALIEAAAEALSEVACADGAAMARLVYHLGNRHALVMLEDGLLKYPADPVLDRMAVSLGFTPRRITAPFQPEAGAWEFLPADARRSLLASPPEIRSPVLAVDQSGPLATGQAEPLAVELTGKKAARAEEPCPSAESPPVLRAPGLLRLLRLASPSLPIGAYAYSQGLEWAVEAGWVRDEAGLSDWLKGLLHNGLSRLELPLLADMHRAWEHGDETSAHTLGATLMAWRDNAEARLEERQTGGALCAILSASGVEAAARLAASGQATCAGAFALACAAWSIPVRECLLAFAFTIVENQTLAGIKLIPLGQAAGQRVLSAVLDAIEAAVNTSLALPQDPLQASTPGRSLAQLLHAGQNVRLFRS